MIISGEPELEFFDQVPTTWDETRIIHGEIGKYAKVARQNGNRWFIGSINGNEARCFEIPLSFLEQCNNYIGLMYSDDPVINTRTRVRIDRYLVDQKTVINEEITASCGQAIMILPAAGDENYPVYE